MSFGVSLYVSLSVSLGVPPRRRRRSIGGMPGTTAAVRVSGGGRAWPSASAAAVRVAASGAGRLAGSGVAIGGGAGRAWPSASAAAAAAGRVGRGRPGLGG